jgi:REP element-mobilizing transposase RayT
MTRERRIWYPGAVYHITTRGNRKEPIFRDNNDYSLYLSILKESLERFDAKLYCYCLMTNHVHLIIETGDTSISEIMKRINSLYTKNFNIKYELIGHLFQGRYYSKLIELTAHAVEASKYIHLNPVKANMVSSPEDYKWSSYGMYIGTDVEKMIISAKILSHFEALAEKHKEGSHGPEQRDRNYGKQKFMQRLLYKQFVVSDTRE